MRESSPPLSILLTNDDGIYAPGLRVMHQALVEKGHCVQVVAPDREYSGAGHGLTLHMPIKVQNVSFNGGCRGWAVAGTPADCVKLALAELLTEPPDMVITGINPGANVGIDLNYSGTVAAAREAALVGLKAMAVSVQYSVEPRYELAAHFAARWVPEVQARPLKTGTFFNINVPDLSVDTIAGVRLGYQGNGFLGEKFEKRRDPGHQPHYLYGCQQGAVVSQGDSDNALLAAGYITITPVRCDMTDYDALTQMQTWDIDPE